MGLQRLPLEGVYSSEGSKADRAVWRNLRRIQAT
jgi:hypothetical protein